MSAWFAIGSFVSFVITLALSGLALHVARRMAETYPLAFRKVNVFGYVTSAVFAMELARSNKDLDAALFKNRRLPERNEKNAHAFDEIESTIQRVAEETEGALDADDRFVVCYTATLLAASALAAFQLQNAWVFGGFGALAVLAGAADLFENHYTRWALCSGRPHTSADRTAPIRRWALVKWHGLAVIGLALAVTLFFFSGSGWPALLSAIVAWFMLALGGACAWQVSRWWRAPEARW